MTAQVAVMNLRGIAVASDTVVTSIQGSDTKTVGNTEKIYELGPKHKVLILHSASVDITGVPHHLHIAEWAKTLGDAKPTLQAYIDSYRAWVATETRMVTPEAELGIIHRQLNDHYYFVKRRLNEELPNLEFEPGASERKKDTARKNTKTILIEQGLEHLRNLETYPTLTDKAAAKLLVDRDVNLDEKIAYIFNGFDLNEAQTQILRDSAPLVLSRVQAMDDLDSDLGFVGFGEEEPYGQVIRLTCRGVYGGTLQAFSPGTNTVLPPKKNAIVSYFAQFDAMWGFVNGANYEFSDEFQRRVADEVEREWGETTPEPIGWNLANKVREEMDAWAQERYIDPMISTIEAMGLKGLAEIADSLVSLQATAANGKRGPATVGGLIEVATIDRINGVQWVRRLSNGIK